MLQEKEKGGREERVSLMLRDTSPIIMENKDGIIILQDQSDNPIQKCKKKNPEN